MPRLAASRPRRIVTTKPPPSAEPPVRVLGKRVEAQFRKAAARAIDQAHAENVPVAILTEDNQVAWLHPDGVVRDTRTPVHGLDAQ